MSRAITPAVALRTSRGLLFAALLLLTWTIGRTFRESTAGALAAPAALTVHHADLPPAAPTDIELAHAIATDLFAVDRAAPAVRYRLARANARANVGAAAAQPLPVRLIGTVIVAAGRSFAMCQLGADQPRLVYPGQRIGAMKLESVSQGSATFTDDAGARVVLRVARAGEFR